MAAGHKVVVDGSNIATEGRSSPSLAQLDEAVRAYLAEHPKADITVVVDATFGHRIDPSERQLFEEARAAGEMVSPPAGAIGRGDAFLLRIAEKTDATVLSNDSFQEFHGEHEWLFTSGRLIGGVPVSGAGWIFTPRSPVRGPKSRQSVQEAKREQRRKGGRSEAKAKAIAEATEEANEPASGRRRRRRRGRGAPSDPLNDPLPFLTFVSAHPLGSQLEATVEEFSSHGAFVQADDVRCYVPLSAMGEPPPRAAREVLTKGETRKFEVQALDPQRRGIELALPGYAHVSGAPTSETVEAEIKEASVAKKKGRSTSRPKKEAAPVAVSELPADAGPSPATVKPRAEKASEDPSRRASRQAGAKVRGARRRKDVQQAEQLAEEIVASAPEPTIVPPKKAATEKAPAKKKATAKKPATKKKATAKKAPAKKKATAKKAATKKKGTAKKAAAKKSSAKSAAAQKRTQAKKPAAKKGASTTKKSPARKATGKKATAKQPATKKAPAKKKSGSKKAPARRSNTGVVLSGEQSSESSSGARPSKAAAHAPKAVAERSGTLRPGSSTARKR